MNESTNKPAQYKITPCIPLILAFIYTVSPVDLVSDALPIAGWLQDSLFLILGVLNSIQNGVLDDNNSLKK